MPTPNPNEGQASNPPDNQAQSQGQPNNQQNNQGLPGYDPYEPSINIKKIYLMLRKDACPLIKELTLPGLFGYSPSHDKFMCLLGLFFELVVATAYFYLGSEKHGDVIAKVFLVVFLIVTVDYLSCWFHQLFVETKKQLRNNKFLLKVYSLHKVKAGYKTYISALNANNPEPKFWHKFFIIFICGIVFVRLYYFFQYAKSSIVFDNLKDQIGNSGFIALAIVIIIIHLSIAWIHIHNTGYALAGIWHTFWEKIDEKRFYEPLLEGNHNYIKTERNINISKFIDELRNDPDKTINKLADYDEAEITKIIEDGFVTDSDILSKSVLHTEYYPHKITNSNDATNDRSSCTIKSVGFLDDQQLRKMIQTQPSTNVIARLAIAMYGVDMQLEFLKTPRDDKNLEKKLKERR